MEQNTRGRFVFRGIYDRIIAQETSVMKKLPLGIQSFKKIINGGYVYADKTQYIYSLLNNASYYFLSRPRRFGKSLLLDTISEVFNGDKELFNGLWIYDSDFEFIKHPILRLDMSNISNETPDILKESLLSVLRKRAMEESLDIADEIPSDLFKHLIEALCKKHGQRVVVLIDEYDKPILDHLTNLEVAEANRAVTKGFYGVLKSMDPYLRFSMLTGVSKFTKTSVFSELNNLLDITMTEEYANICGIAIEDIDKYFGDHIKSMSALDRFKHCGNFKDEILAWYDGYSWDGATRVLNPFSLLSFFIQKRFVGFWYASGTPAFLIKLIKENPDSFLAIKNYRMSEEVLDSFDIKKMDIEPLLFQTGYLTVKEKAYFGFIDEYLLGIPNFEVEQALNLNIIAEFTEKGNSFAATSSRRMIESLKSGDILGMASLLRPLFASIPHNLHINREAYYHSIIYAIMNVLGLNMSAEVSVSGGRVDAVLELEEYVYIMEFKYRDCAPGTTPEEKSRIADEALKEGMCQIKEKGYYKKYLGSPNKIVCLAAFAFLGRDNIEIRVEYP